MDGVYEFFSAALPWIAMGLLLAIFFVRGASAKKKDSEKPDDYGTEGMCLGMCFGTALGTSLFDNSGLGISLGMLIGLAVGSSIHKKSDEEK